MNIETEGKGLSMADEDKSTLHKLLFGSGHSEQKEKVLEYIGHRLKDGAHLRDVVQEDYVRRNCTQAELDEIMADPKLVQQGRAGLEEYFDSGELNPKHATARVKGQSTEGARSMSPFQRPPKPRLPNGERAGAPLKKVPSVHAEGCYYSAATKGKNRYHYSSVVGFVLMAWFSIADTCF